MRNYFHCSGYRTSHQLCNNGPHCGHCATEFAAKVSKLGIRPKPARVGADLTPLFRKTCGPHDAFTQLDSFTTTGCLAPQARGPRRGSYVPRGGSSELGASAREIAAAPRAAAAATFEGMPAPAT